ncbi:MAG: hypothetical protein AB7I79_19665 [Rhizobiaceae bacterium]
MRSLLMVMAILACAGGSAAASLDIEGTYGSPAGCKYAADSVYGDETVTVLDAEHYENFVTYCEFVQILPARDGSHIVTMLCGHEGDEAQTIEQVRIAKAAEGDAYNLFHASGEPWDSVTRCEAGDAAKTK